MLTGQIDCCVYAHTSCECMCQPLWPSTLQYRMRFDSKKYQQLRTSLILMQSSIRRRSDLKKYQQLRAKSIRIQSAIRSRSEHKKYQQMRAKSIRIQSALRRGSERKKYKQLRINTVLIQSLMRKRSECARVMCYCQTSNLGIARNVVIWIINSLICVLAVSRALCILSEKLVARG